MKRIDAEKLEALTDKWERDGIAPSRIAELRALIADAAEEADGIKPDDYEGRPAPVEGLREALTEVRRIIVHDRRNKARSGVGSSISIRRIDTLLIKIDAALAAAPVKPEVQAKAREPWAREREAFVAGWNAAEYEVGNGDRIDGSLTAEDEAARRYPTPPADAGLRQTLLGNAGLRSDLRKEFGWTNGDYDDLCHQIAVAQEGEKR